MPKTATAEHQNLESKPLEVEVIIPEEVLKREQQLKSIYNNGKLKYNFGNELPKNVQEEIAAIIKASKVDEIVKFNPLLISLVELQSFKELKYDSEKNNDRDYIDSNKKIGTFNTAIKETTDLMKKDANEYVKKVNGIRDFFLTEAKTTREILNKNFKDYLDEKERKKKEAEKKKNDAIIKANEELTKQNQEQAEKLKNQKKESKKLTIQGEIGKIAFSATSGISVLNLDGLEKLKKDTENKSFPSLLPENDILEYGFTNDEVFEFQNEFNNAVSTSLNAINKAISNLNLTKENNTLKIENQIIKASQPEVILSENSSTNFTESISINESSNKDLEIENPDLSTDRDKMALLLSIIENFNNEILHCHSEIEKIQFNDPGLQKIHDIIYQKSFAQIKDWGSKLVEWTTTKNNAYVQHLNNLQTN